MKIGNEDTHIMSLKYIRQVLLRIKLTSLPLLYCLHIYTVRIVLDAHGGFA